MRGIARYRFNPLLLTIYLTALAVGGWSIIHSSAWGEEAAVAEDPFEGFTVEATPPAQAPPVEPAAVADVPTHKQTATISANVDGQPNVQLTCFCLTPDDRIVAGCTGASNELRVFDADGKYLETWESPVKPEAIFVLADGRILLAGDGELVRLTAEGKVELQKPGPHAAEIKSNPDKVREEVIQQAKEQAEQFGKQTEQFDKMIERADKEIAKLKEQMAALDAPAEDSATEDADATEDAEEKPAADNARVTMKKAMFERRLAMFEQAKKQYSDIKKQFAEQLGEAPPAELTDEQIDERIKASIAYKLKASSVSAAGDEVFLATRALTGYGYAIWRMDGEFENGAQIVSELRGCCGQMDVKANQHGLFVAENSRHRVCRYDREGTLVSSWGEGAREGLEGFGSCCNPMNVAFGPDDVVYTAEDNTGRIKRYSVDGTLLGLVGSVDLVPGCKNVSIAVSKDGSRVYMLDITRHHIVRMDARDPGDVSEQASAQANKAFGTNLARKLQVLFTDGN